MASASLKEFPQAAELAEVKEAFPNRCRIMKNIDIYSNVVTLQPKDMDITFKFHLKGEQCEVSR